MNAAFLSVCHCLRRTKLRRVTEGHCSRLNDCHALRASSAGWRAIRVNRRCEQWHTGRWWAVPFLLVALFAGCSKGDTRTVITIWHQSRPAEYQLLRDEIKRFEATHPRVRVRALYKETEELRSGFQAAALAGGGPELIYGPSDVLGTLQTMGVVQDVGPWFPAELRGDFVEGALTYLPKVKSAGRRGEGDAKPQAAGGRQDLVQVADRFGNHLALVYNRRLIAEPPRTTDELVALAVKNTIDEDGDGRKERYGLVWNFTEPFFGIPFLTGFGGWVFVEPSARPTPSLDTPQAVAAWQFMQSLQEQGVAPKNCDYEAADSLFKSGKAAMIINGDWSWADYLATPGIEAAVAVLPTVNATGEPMRTMFAPKGYSLNVNTPPEIAAEAMAFVRHMTSDEVQRRIVHDLRMLPARRSIQQDPLFETDPTLQASFAQLKNGRLMPVETELRAVWDAMRPPYQAVLGGGMTPAEAAADMQKEALAKIEQIHTDAVPDNSVAVINVVGLLLAAALVVWQRNSFVQFVRDWRRNRLAYLFVLPSIVCIFAVIVFPFFYNIVLSLSNMSLSNFRDWQVVGLRNYAEVFTDPKIWLVFFKTIAWTAVNVAFHVGLGVLLAVALNGPIRGKAIYRILLIIPWAVPAYITALSGAACSITSTGR